MPRAKLRRDPTSLRMPFCTTLGRIRWRYTMSALLLETDGTVRQVVCLA